MHKLFLHLLHLMRRIPGAQLAVWRMRQSWNALKRILLVRRPLVDGGDLIERAIRSRTPFAAGKMGSVEALALSSYLKRLRVQEKKPGNISWLPAYPAYVFHTLFVNAGVFPQDADLFDRFCQMYLKAVQNCDALVSWDIAGEACVLARYCPTASLIHIRDLEPYFSPSPWSRALAGKRVLVISPFASSIEQQYAKREKIWPRNNEILPSFDLITIKAPLSAGLVAPEATDWFDALNKMTAQMDATAYDVALIGAGAFSLPLVMHAKQQGKIGLHLGGSLQILFGVLGKRWEGKKDFQSFITNDWARPTQQETPPTVASIEGGCYW